MEYTKYMIELLANAAEKRERDLDKVYSAITSKADGCIAAHAVRKHKGWVAISDVYRDDAINHSVDIQEVVKAFIKDKYGLKCRLHKYTTTFMERVAVFEVYLKY